jgi:hypothetical protein
LAYVALTPAFGWGAALAARAALVAAPAVLWAALHLATCRAMRSALAALR